MYSDSTLQEIDQVMTQAHQAFMKYKNMPLKSRAQFMRSIAIELESAGDELIHAAMEESHLPEGRLRNERGRTIFQLNSYAEACEKGDWLEATIDSGLPDNSPPKPDIRKMLVPLGPVVVFGSSNFPFAYSTAGGDTACALAAGCPVVVKAHPAHAKTSTLVANAIHKAVAKCNMPDGIFAHVYGVSFDVGKALVIHKYTQAVGFTGSYIGGKQLFDWANQRAQPIPVFAEMGSTNPVFLLPEKLNQSAVEVAKMYAGSITLGVGQFCTNPGVIVGIKSPSLQEFINTLGQEIKNITPAPMLHQGIANAYKEKSNLAISQKDVTVVSQSSIYANDLCGIPTITTTNAQNYISNEVLHQEVFGPYSIIVVCENIDEILEVAHHMEGQLTVTLMATDDDLSQNDELIQVTQNLCGRIILNGVPTGVEVCKSMHHGGPFPSTTDSRFTAVGADGIKRFARPLSFQNWPQSILPQELQNGNPLQIWRTVNNELTKDPI